MREVGGLGAPAPADPHKGRLESFRKQKSIPGLLIYQREIAALIFHMHSDSDSPFLLAPSSGC